MNFVFPLIVLLIMVFGNTARADIIEKASHDISASLIDFARKNQDYLGKKPKIGVVNYIIEKCRGQEKTQEMLAESLSIEMSESDYVEIIERSRIVQLIKENIFEEMGFVDRENAERIEEISGVKYILSGQVAVTKWDFIVITFLTDASDGTIVWSHFLDIPYDSKYDYSNRDYDRFLWLKSSIALLDKLFTKILKEEDKIGDNVLIFSKFNNTSSREYFGIENFATNYAVYKMVDNGFLVVERRNLAPIMDEMNRKEMGIVSNNEVSEILLKDADMIVMGYLKLNQDNTLYNDLNMKNSVTVNIGLNMKFVYINTGEVAFGVSERGDYRY